MVAGVPRRSGKPQGRGYPAAEFRGHLDAEKPIQMNRFMLDTDSVSFALRSKGQVNDRIVRHLPTETGLSAIMLSELRYGARYRTSKLTTSTDQQIRRADCRTSSTSPACADSASK